MGGCAVVISPLVFSHGLTLASRSLRATVLSFHRGLTHQSMILVEVDGGSEWVWWAGVGGDVLRGVQCAVEEKWRGVVWWVGGVDEWMAGCVDQKERCVCRDSNPGYHGHNVRY